MNRPKVIAYLYHTKSTAKGLVEKDKEWASSLNLHFKRVLSMKGRCSDSVLDYFYLFFFVIDL